MDAILWQEKSLSLLDQSKYPREEVWLDCPDYETVAALLKTPQIRGDAIVASAGAYGLCLAALAFEGSGSFYQDLTRAKKAILDSRPKCKALQDAMGRMDKAYEEYRNSPELITALLAMAVTVHRQDVIACRWQNRNGRDIIPDEANIVVSCRGSIFHTGSPFGPLGILKSASAKQKISQVFLCENRPGLEGANLVAHEMVKNNIPTTVIPDHAAAALMPRRSCDMVLLEGLSLAANGDLLAGPGTYELAIAAYFHSIPVYATLLTTDIDLSVPNGETFAKKDGDVSALSPLPEGALAWTPETDMILNPLLTGIITERGIIFPPFEETIGETLAKPVGTPALIL